MAPAVEGRAAAGRRPRIVYLPGPGDVYGSYRHWRAGHDDPRLPSLAYSAQVFEAVRAQGAELLTLTQHPLPTPDDADADAIAAPDAHGFRFAHRPQRKAAGLAHHLAQIRQSRALAREAAAFGADVVIVQRMLPHYWPFLALRRRGTALIASLHSTLWPSHRPPNRQERLLARLNAPFFRACVAVCSIGPAPRAQVAAITGLAPRPPRLPMHLPQYPEAWRDAWRDRAGGPEGGRIPHRLLFVGRIERDKGVFDLLDAFAALAPDHPGLTLRYLGRGRALDALRDRAAAAPCAARIDVAGLADGATVRAALQDSDLLVCPTQATFSEGLTKTPVEAALCGLPTLMTEAVPTGRVLEGCSLTVPCGDPAALARAIAGLRADPARYAAMAAATRPLREQFFDRDRSLGRILRDALAEALPPSGPG